MIDHQNKSDNENEQLDPTANDHPHEHDKAQGHRGRDAHGGDVAPPNDDQAGRRQSPQSGEPVKR